MVAKEKSFGGQIHNMSNASSTSLPPTEPVELPDLVDGSIHIGSVVNNTVADLLFWDLVGLENLNRDCQGQLQYLSQ